MRPLHCCALRREQREHLALPVRQRPRGVSAAHRVRVQVADQGLDDVFLRLGLRGSHLRHLSRAGRVGHGACSCARTMSMAVEARAMMGIVCGRMRGPSCKGHRARLAGAWRRRREALAALARRAWYAHSAATAPASARVGRRRGLRPGVLSSLPSNRTEKWSCDQIKRVRPLLANCQCVPLPASSSNQVCTEDQGARCPPRPGTWALPGSRRCTKRTSLYQRGGLVFWRAWTRCQCPGRAGTPVSCPLSRAASPAMRMQPG